MTNKEWLMSLDSYDCALFCIEWLPLVRDDVSTVYGISEWLDSEYNPEYHIVNKFNKVMRINPPTRR